MLKACPYFPWSDYFSICDSDTNLETCRVYPLPGETPQDTALRAEKLAQLIELGWAEWLNTAP
jgi:hypothetical protein